MHTESIEDAEFVQDIGNGFIKSCPIWLPGITMLSLNLKLCQLENDTVKFLAISRNHSS